MHEIQEKQEVKSGSKRTSALSKEVVCNQKLHYFSQL